MTNFKRLEDLTEPEDVGFVVIDRDAPGFVRPVSVEDQYREAAELELPDSVPEGIRSYFDSTRLLWVYGVFHYPFYSMAAVHAALCAEGALRERFEREGVFSPGKKPSLQSLIKDAIARKWLAPTSFSNIRRRLERERQWEEQLAQIRRDEPEIAEEFFADATAGTTADELAQAMERHLDTFRRFRNLRAHPRGLMVWLPHMAYSEIEYARDLIAQLFPSTNTAMNARQ